MALPALPVLSMHEWVTRHIVQDAAATVGVRIQRVRALCQLGLPSQAVQLLSMLLKVQRAVQACVQGCTVAVSATGRWLLWVLALSKAGPSASWDCQAVQQLTIYLRVIQSVKTSILVIVGAIDDMAGTSVRSKSRPNTL